MERVPIYVNAALRGPHTYIRRECCWELSDLTRSFMSSHVCSPLTGRAAGVHNSNDLTAGTPYQSAAGDTALLHVAVRRHGLLPWLGRRQLRRR
jgi:hypothetical protein